VSPQRQHRPDLGDAPDLDRLLDAWAERVRLGDDRAEQIRAAVIADPPAMDQRWWLDLVGRVTATVLQSTTMPAEARRALVPAGYAW